MAMTITTGRDTQATSTGDKNHTVSGAGTPKLGLFIPNSASVNATVGGNALLGLGMTHGPSSGHGFAGQGESEDGVATSNTTRSFDNNDCITGTIPTVFAADWRAWITDGVTLNYRNLAPGANFLGLVFFGGSDITVDTHVLSNGSTSKTGMSFEPDVLIVSAGNTATPTIGFAVNPDVNPASASVVNCGMGWFSSDNSASANPKMVSWDDKCCGQTFTSIEWSAAVTAFNSDGYSITSVSDNCHVAAIKLGGSHKAWCGVVDAPTSTGNQSYTDPQFTPVFMMQLLNHITTTNTLKTDATGGAAGVRITDGTNEHSFCYLDEDAATTMNTGSFSDTKLNLLQDDQTTGMTATLSSFDTNGWTDNYTATHNAAKLPTLCIGDVVAATGRKSAMMLLGVH